MTDEEPRKRSRFDQTEPPRKSRFDRRSRSPVRRESDVRRSRSPVTKSIESPAGEDKKDAAAAAAAAAAARINASINAKKGIQHVDVPPIRPTQSPSAGAGAAKSPSQSAPSGALNDEIYTQDGDYIKDIEVNDLRNRYTLTKGSTQKMIKEKTGADVTTRGNYYPDKSLATAANPPLYLHVTSTTKDGLEKAVKEIDELMKQELPNLIDERRFRRREEPVVERDSLGRRKWPEEHIPIDLEPIPGFNLRAQVVGAGGSYVKYIQGETRCRVQIKGRGSGFMEHDTGRESDEQMYLHVAGPDPAEVERAKEMCIELLNSVKTSYDQFKERPPRNSGGGGYGGGGYGGGGDDQQRGGYHNRDRQQSGSYGGGGSQTPGYGGGSSYNGGYNQQPATPAGYGGGAMSPQGAGIAQAQAAPPQAAMSPAEQQQQYQAWAAYYAQNPQADPYAAYGGYGAVMAAYMQNPDYYQQQQQAGQNGAAPPPPQDDQGAPPPPPPGAGNGGGYNQVPPPPGM
ncbi:hypothetical protein LTR85_006715 [Meristemomyces frigidus]|nr:hypothetical protein LTR85_006715 [Meristemomyces frigidus]